MRLVPRVGFSITGTVWPWKRPHAGYFSLKMDSLHADMDSEKMRESGTGWGVFGECAIRVRGVKKTRCG